MTRRNKWFALLATLMCTTSVAAQGDLAISASTSRILVTPDRVQTVTYIVTNQGPGDLAGVMVGSTGVDASSVVISVLPDTSCPGAQVVDTAGQLVLAWNIGALRALESVACIVAFRAAPAASSGNLLFVAFGAALGNKDPNPFNDGVSVGVTFSAVDAPVDARISAQMDPGGTLRQGIAQRLRVTVANVGTTPIPAVTVLSPGYDQAPSFSGFTGYDLFEITETAPCFMIVDAEPPFVFFVAFGFDALLAPGASRTCTIGIRALPGASGVAKLPLELFPRGTGVYDIAPQDNSTIVQVDFGSFGTPRAVPIAPWGLVVMSLMIVGFGAIHLCCIRTTRR